MASTLSVSIDRTSLSLSALEFTQDASTGRWLDMEGQSRPALTWSRSTASSPFVHGTALVAAALEQSSLPLALYLSASTTADLYTAMGALQDALAQFSYTVTVTENSSAATWTCDPADLAWSDFLHGWTDEFVVRATVTIPVYPVSS